ncbi:MAG TPA: hypothetical protein VG937_20025 [Polyangiaceae bacterium]|nr:hypothetical protein [Polyangiaceae bacterium]
MAASATASAALAPAKARIGGNVAVVGNHSVELLLHQSGKAEALVSDGNGELVSSGIALSLSANTQSHQKESLALAYSAPRARFEGQAKAGVELASGPVELTLSVNGKAAEARLAALAVKGPEVGGNVLIVGEHSAEVLLRPTGEVLAFVRDAAGAQLSSQAGLSVNATVHVAAGGSESVALNFDAARKCFAGKVKAGVELAPGPLELSIAGKAGVSLGRLAQVSLRADAAHGGEVLVVGDYSVELVAKGKELHAFVFDANGKASSAANLDLRLDLAALVNPNVALTWDAASGSYRAALNGKVDFDAQPIKVTLAVDGRAFAGAAASLSGIVSARIAPPSLSADAKLNADAKVAADAKAGADAKLGASAKLKVPDVKANLTANAQKAASAAAAVKVEAPKVNVQKSASASTSASKTGGSAKASAGFSLGFK